MSHSYALIFYSHSDYSDVWAPMFKQADKYFPNYQKYLFSDNKSTEIERPNWTLIKYDDTKKYQQRLIYCLDQIEEEIILFHHEDMFLYGEPKYECLEEISTAIKNEEIDIVKLICASYGTLDTSKNITSLSYVYENPLNLKFAIQPSMCRKAQLRFIYDKTGGDNIWLFETYSSGTVDYFDIKTGMTYLPEDEKRGQFHWDSSIYPYFATAIVKGKWNFSDYEEMLKPLLKANNIDYGIRGTC
ncbi:hypothetical protein CMI47_23300 [Candidatus Pacearchaeota archaeon]|nr:hypothetical protein [Candidatus Pacearchaeota archaeon]